MTLITDKNDFQLIERFFERELTEDELAHFRQRLDTDTDFAEQVGRFGEAHQTVEAIYYPDEKKNFKQKWQKILQTPHHQANTKKPVTYYLIRAAAILIFVIGIIGLSQYAGTSENNPRQLALQNWEKTEATDMSKGLRRGEIKRAVIWNNAEKSYKAGKFEEALTFLVVLGDEPDALLWSGKCYFELREIPEAISHFEAVVQHEEGGKKDLALWYQALGYLYENNTDAAREKLNLIIENKYFKAGDAAQLLEQL